MTIDTTSNVKTYTGNGMTTAYSTVFVFYESSDILVTIDGTTKVLDTDYTVSGGNGAIGTVTFTTAPASSTAIVLQRIVDYEQQTDFENYDGNPADVTEKQFDLVVMQTQQLSEELDRSLKVLVGTSGFNGDIPSLTSNGEKFLRLKSDLSGFEWVTAVSSGDLVVSSYIETLIDDATAADARTTLGLGTISTQDSTSVSITGGTIDGVTLGTTSAITEAQIDNININGNEISSTNTDGDISLNPNGSGRVDVNTSIIENVTDPTAAQHAATKNYVDGLKATQANMESEAAAVVYADVFKYHPGAGKVWIKCNASGTINASYNVTSITDTGTGIVTVTIADDFSSSNYAIVVTLFAGTTNDREVIVTSQAAGSFVIESHTSSGTLVDPSSYFAIAMGDQ